MWFNINRNGQLGNRLFSRAHVYAAAIEHREIVVDWGLLDVAPLFPRVGGSVLPIYPLLENGDPPPLPCSALANRRVLTMLHDLRPRATGQFGPFWSQNYGSGDAELMRLDGEAFRKFRSEREIIILNGFKLRCTNWVRKHKDEVRRYFELPPSVRQKWSILRSAWHGKFSEVVGIHMRLTDFRTAGRGRYFLTPKEYAGLLRERTNFDSRTALIVIFTDEKFRDSKRFEEIGAAFEGLTTYINQGDVIDDLGGLMACDRIVGPSTSTFSRWAAFAADRQWAGISRDFLTHTGVLDFITCPIPWDY